jgi:hypothetical protein
MEPKPLTPAQKLVILLNFPALILGIPFALVFFHGSDMASLYAAMVGMGSTGDGTLP